MKQSGLQRARQSTRKKIKKSLGPDFLDPSNLGLHGKEAQSDVRCDICQDGLPSGSRRDSITCRKCPVQAHASCIRAQLNVKYIKSLWLCLNCRHCYECDESGVDQSELIFCRTCDLSYHYECIRSISSSGGKWICLQCKKPQLPISRFHGFRQNRVAKTLNKSHSEDKSPDITTSHPSSSSSTPSTSRASLSVKKELITEKQKPSNNEKTSNNERSLRSDQTERPTRSERPERSVNANSNSSRRQEKTETPERQEKTEKTDQPERPMNIQTVKRSFTRWVIRPRHVEPPPKPKPGSDDINSVKTPQRPASIDPMSSKRPERPANIDQIGPKKPGCPINIDSAGSKRPERSMSMDSTVVKRSMPIEAVSTKLLEIDDPFAKRPERPASIDRMSSKRPMNIDAKRHNERSPSIDSTSSKRLERPISIESANSKKPERPLSMGSIGAKRPDRPINTDSTGSKRPDRPMSIETIGPKRPERPITIDSTGAKRIERPLSIDSINSRREMSIESVSTKRPMNIELVSSKRPMRVNQVVNDNRSSIDLPDVDMIDSFTEKPLVKEVKDKYIDRPRIIRHKVEPERENNMVRSKEVKDKDEKQQSSNENRRMSEERSENNRNPMNVLKANGPTRGNALLSLNDLGNGNKSDGMQPPVPPKVTVSKKDASEIQGTGFILSKPVELTEETARLLKDSNGAKRLKLVLFERACKAESLLPAETNIWTVEDVHNFIKFIGFPDAAENFSEHQIDGKSLLLLSRKDVITGFKLKLGPALKIYAHIFRLQRKRPALLLEEQ
ncbi:neurofilament heavy polypeptide [Tetranychus urticae]|uniref:PHD finger protein 10 n=1 Tax=Tetranychus urticae TaxID=32264 RepID=T1KLH4_TETUR|nr:neurofilament heavy polypeptide [Tetranychus urticae]XP_015788251.1 neurofilament heavy polypeptide [Tetranychus urticae]XP_025017252.1 neurofilament heavy polypeptide [Tetranychus urticae]